MLWGMWSVGLLATALLTPMTLSALRLVAPAAPIAALWAAGTGLPSPVAALAGILVTLVAAGLALSAEVGRAFVNGPAYGDERRHLLRLPAPLLVGLVPLTWGIAAGAVVAGPLLLACRLWFVAVPVVVAGVPATVVAVRSLHGLTQRWVVLVPAGLVLKDQLALVDPVLFQRGVIESLRPAPADSDSLDLTGAAPGLALELILAEKVEMTLVRPRERLGETGSSARLLFTPTRPGAVLADAAGAHIHVG